jgi:hypothetical protein
MSETPETDAAWKEGNAIKEWTCRKLERERDEARAVAGELADVASKYLSFLLAVTPTKANETHEKETMKVIDALKRWKKLSSHLMG